MAIAPNCSASNSGCWDDVLLCHFKKSRALLEETLTADPQLEMDLVTWSGGFAKLLEYNTLDTQLTRGGKSLENFTMSRLEQFIC
jgi:hypothetical protein